MRLTVWQLLLFVVVSVIFIIVTYIVSDKGDD